MKRPEFGSLPFNKQSTTPTNTDSQANKKNEQETVTDKPLYTGRYLIKLIDGQDCRVVRKVLESKLGFKVACSDDFKDIAITEFGIENSDALIYKDLGIALIDGEEQQIKRIQSATTNFIIEPEKIVYLPGDIQGVPDISSTWGLRATKVIHSNFTGKGVKVAVLDTGLDLQHPDFTGRQIHAESFVPNEAVEDLHGHGTHCIGTACGKTDINHKRYGIASDSVIYAGKVLSNQGSGAQSWILNAITWAVKNGCKVISMSLGSKVFPSQSYDLAYERVAQYALSKGCIIVAAAGNDSIRSQNVFAPVGSPADCPSILAVAAIDPDFNVADFSNRSINPTGKIAIAAPGVMVLSSWPMPKRYNTISGTSMATPHVAGILALLWEKHPNATPQQIIEKLKAKAKNISLQSIDVGVGLTIAP
jgi:hypothetical protein